MDGIAAGTSLSGTYTDTLGDSGTWAASPARYLFGDALSLTDATAKVSIMALPNLLAANSFNFSYKFDPTAASCPGDFGQGVVTINLPLWDY